MFNNLIQVVALMATGSAFAAEYVVWVGYENVAVGLEINKMMPDHLKIHPGDTVTFRQKSFDPHTVTFHPGTPLPDLFVNGFELNLPVAVPTPLVGDYDGSTFLSSGMMAKGTPLTSFKVTFSTVGDFKYGCSVHGASQNGTISVVAAEKRVATPKEISRRRKYWRASIDARAPRIYAKALKSVTPKKDNGDGTYTHYVLTGFMQPPFEFMSFFPRKLVVNQGDKIIWYGAVFHTVTFLNGRPEPPLVVPNAEMKPVLNPAVYTPVNTTIPLTRNGMVNAGLLLDPNIKFTLTVGEVLGSLPYICIPHRSSGMTASVVVKNN